MLAVYIICFAALLAAIYSYIETMLIKTVTYSVASAKIARTFDNKRILLLSDLHCISFGKDNYRLYEAIEKASPDIIVIAGDLINGNSKDFVYPRKLLEKLNSMGIPVYYSFGNHECKLANAFHGEGEFERYTVLSEKYCTVLNNAHADIDQNTVIYGLMLPLAQFDMKLKDGLLEPVEVFLGRPDKERYNIMIAHDPSYIREYLDWGADLVLSGHLHGGIVRLPLLGGLISPRYTLFPKPDKGYYGYNGQRAHVISAGLGWHAIPFRFMNRPELVVVELKSSDEQE